MKDKDTNWNVGADRLFLVGLVIAIVLLVIL
jgi:hypothetical protein